MLKMNNISFLLQGGIYNPSLEEIAIADYHGYENYLLLTGPVIVRGVQCWECQDSAGENWGDHMFVFIRRKHNLITEFIEMQVYNFTYVCNFSFHFKIVIS